MDWRLFAWVIGGTFTHAAMNVVLRKLFKEHELDAAAVTSVTMLIASAVSFVSGYFYFGAPDIKREFFWAFITTALFNVVIQYGNVRAKQLAEVSLVVPIQSTMPLFAVVAAFLLLGEWPTFWGRVGILLIATGSYVLNLQAGKEELPSWAARLIPKEAYEFVRYYLNPWLRLLSNRGVQISFGTACCGAISVSFDKIATLASDGCFATGMAFGFVGIATALPTGLKKGWVGIPAVWRELFLIGLLHGITGSAYNIGYYYGIVPYVGAMKRVQILWTIILAGTLLGESNMWGRLLGAAIMLVGLFLLGF